ncbi:hypothetical protein EMGBD1_15240 [Anaerolineaceae bacterium]|nr:hypothetical protein EMGBD1_15240 [Anaerolineaceae bacterium]
MQAHACKITCVGCGYRFDCSDLSLNFDVPAGPPVPVNAAAQHELRPWRGAV